MKMLKNVVGMEEFHAGKADKISGLEKVDDQTVVIHLKEVYPALEKRWKCYYG